MNVDLKTSMSARRLDNTGLEQPVKGDVAKMESVQPMRFSDSALKVTAASASPLAALDEVQDADLRRDDDLGQLMMQAFDFQPPEMPNFV